MSNLEKMFKVYDNRNMCGRAHDEYQKLFTDEAIGHLLAIAEAAKKVVGEQRDKGMSMTRVPIADLDALRDQLTQLEGKHDGEA